MPAAGRPPQTAVAHEVERRRLLRLLERSSTPVVVISAPAGAGKSTLAQQWIARDPRAHVTLRLTPSMDDPVVLVPKLLDALESVGAPSPGTKARITAKEPVFSATLLPALTRIAASREEPFILVLDDVQVLESAAAQQVLEAVCDGTPTDSTVVLLTRSVAPDWLSRIRAAGRLTEVPARDLNFDRDETVALMDAMGVRIDPDQVARIIEHTEGWAVGVYLSALGLLGDDSGGRTDVRITQGSDRAVRDYIRTQVLAPLSEDHREFLTLSSVLDELNGPLCDAVLERDDSAAVLAHLHERIQLVIALDREESRYRCHPLLAEELLADLRRYEPARISGLHERASAWFEGHGERDDAIRHATASGDVALASRIIWPEVVGCVATGRLDLLRSWLAGLTDKQVAGDPWLSMAAVWAYLQQGDADAMGRWARIVEAHAGPGWRDAARRDPYAATLAVLYALVGAGGLADTRDLCERALQGLPPDDRFRAPAEINRATMLMLLGEREAGRAGFREAERLARSMDVPIVEVNARSWLGLLALDDGDRERGVAMIADTTDTIRRHHLDRIATGAMCMTAQALVLVLRGDKSAAATTLATARRLTGLAGDIAPWFAVTGRLIQARTAVHLGDGATARLLITEAKSHMTSELAATTVTQSIVEAEDALATMNAHGGPATALTTAELRILQFLPSHLTLAQIGEHLYVSASTVKTHVLSIYRKFGVGSRAEAVDRARALGLVEAPIVD